MPETQTAITLGEIARGVEKAANGVDAARAEIQELRAEVNAHPDWEDVKRVERGLEQQIRTVEAAAKTKDALQDLAISKLEGWGNWATKAAGGVIIAAVLVRSGLG